MPATHHAAQKVVLSRLQGEDEDEFSVPLKSEDEPKTTAGAAIIYAHGILGKHLSGLEMMCGGCSIDQISLELDLAAEDSNADRMFINFNSPGGSYPGIPELARKIAQVDSVKPVYAFVDPLCCSGALWLASACREVFALPSSCIGSVGVYSIYLDATGYYKDLGVKFNAISSGKYKLTGADFKEMTDEEREMLQAEIDRIHAEFKTAVTSRRKVDAEYLEGQTFSGEEAVKIGFASTTIDSIEEAIALTQQLHSKAA